MARQWKGTTFGGEWLHKSLIVALRYIDIRLVYAFAALFIVPICSVVNKSRKSAYDYFRNRLNYGWWKSVWNVYLNHYKFAQVVIDKFAMYAGKRFLVEVEGAEAYHRLEAKSEGFVILSSHIGNYEIAGYTFSSGAKRMNILVFAHEKASVMRNRSNLFDKNNVQMIAIEEDMRHLYEIDNELRSGNIVTLHADRSAGATKSIEGEFLGYTAKFPLGPLNVVTMRGLDALAANVTKVAWNRYKLSFTQLEYYKSAPRKEQTKQLSRGYIAALEKCVKEHPTQWFNFYNFWI